MSNLVKTVTRIITVIGEEKAVDSFLEEPVSLTIGKFTYSSDSTGKKLHVIVQSGGVTKHDPSKNSEIYNKEI